METLYSDRILDLKYEPEKKCLVQVWKGFCTSEEFRASQQKSLDLFIEKRCTNFISDTTNASLLKKEDTDWASANIMPKLFKAGMKKLNMVLPSSMFTKLTISNLEKAEETSGRDIFKKFGSLESALADL